MTASRPNALANEKTIELFANEFLHETVVLLLSSRINLTPPERTFPTCEKGHAYSSLRKTMEMDSQNELIDTSLMLKRGIVLHVLNL